MTRVARIKPKLSPEPPRGCTVRGILTVTFSAEATRNGIGSRRRRRRTARAPPVVYSCYYYRCIRFRVIHVLKNKNATLLGRVQ